MRTDWERVYESTWESLVRFLDRKVWDRERARDLAQEAFLRALSTDATIDNPKAWLFTVAGNLARDEARSAGRKRRHLELMKAEATEADQAADADEQRQRKTRRAEMKEALSRLSERDRHVLLLWDAGLSYDEIAEQSGLARGAIGTTLSRARRRLVEAHAEGRKGDHVARN